MAVHGYPAVLKAAASWAWGANCELKCPGLPGQDDLLYETLTVHETLYYAAMLRLPSTMTVAQKEERVLNVIHTLGLDKCRDTIVGAWSAMHADAEMILHTSCWVSL